MLFVGQHTQGRTAVAHSFVFVLLLSIELADDLAAVEPRPKEVDAKRAIAIQGPWKRNLELREREP